MRRQRGAALLALVAVLCAITAAAAIAQMRQLARAGDDTTAEQRALALARDALRGDALRRRCADPARPPDTLLACPESGGAEGDAAENCAGTSRGWLPWRSLGVAPLRDGSGTCLWMERDGLTARVIAPGAPSASQVRAGDPARVICPGSQDPTQYLEAGDRSLALTLHVAALAAACP
jgi:hypothetical protein